MAPKPHPQAQRYMLRSSVKQNLPSTPTKQLPKPSTHRKVCYGKMWHLDIEKMFVHIMIDQKNKGKTLPFGRRAWSEIKAKLNERGNRNFTSKQCREKYQRIRRSFNHFTRLISQKGFIWDAKTNTVIAEEETWQNYLLADKDAKKFRKKGAANYKLLALLFHKPSAKRAQEPPNSSCASNSTASEFERARFRRVLEFERTCFRRAYRLMPFANFSRLPKEDYERVWLMLATLEVEEMRTFLGILDREMLECNILPIFGL